MNRCLIVDDSHVIRKVARAILEGLRFEVAEAESGEEALKHCDARMPDLIILDWHMPGMCTIEFLTALRTRLSGRRPRILYLTTELDIAGISRAITSGADDYLMKPFNRQMVEAKLTEVHSAA
ncbi:MAG: response regulator [Pseudomonadota bacterium]